MTEYAIRSFSVAKTYRRGIKALDDVSISIPKGSIYGLIGRNGAGKTTLIKILTGTVLPTEGYIAINEHTSEKDLCEQRKKIGSIVESPVFYAFMTAQQNLIARAKLLGVSSPKAKIFDMLALFGLENAANQKVGTFSLGMKQRLALAQAMLDSPEMLILDEPTNGLDPIGIQHMRKVLSDLNSNGVTILISSHLLSELTQIATVYGILEKGRLVKEVSNEEIQGLTKGVFDIGFSNLVYLNKAVGILSDIVGENNLKIDKNVLKVRDTTDTLSTDTIVKILIDNQLQFISVAPSETALENYFLNFMQGEKQ